MTNLVIITSVIDTPNKPYSYTQTRSVFSRKERFDQTKKTIESIRKKIPNSDILIVECSDFSEEKEQLDYFKTNTDYFLNLWDKKELHSNIFGISKALGEGTLTIKAIDYIKDNKLTNYDNYFKISGRYFINDNFHIENYQNNETIFNKPNDINIIQTICYKIYKDHLDFLYKFLSENVNKMRQNIFFGYEELFMEFFKHLSEKTTKIKVLNRMDQFSGFVSVDGTRINL